MEKCYKLIGFPLDFKFTKNKEVVACVHTNPFSYETFPSTDLSPAYPTDVYSHSFSKEQYHHLQNFFHQQTQIPNCKTVIFDEFPTDPIGFAHFAGPFIDYATKSLSSYASDNAIIDIYPWVLDSGATNHMRST